MPRTASYEKRSQNWIKLILLKNINKLYLIIKLTSLEVMNRSVILPYYRIKTNKD